jgi:hypothetical protein
MLFPNSKRDIISYSQLRIYDIYHSADPLHLHRFERLVKLGVGLHVHNRDFE